MALVDRISKLVKKENSKFDLKRCRIGKKTFHWRKKKTRSPKKLKRNWNSRIIIKTILMGRRKQNSDLPNCLTSYLTFNGIGGYDFKIGKENS
ncbi:hypothetical protein BpHYR1_003836 [Brachionus plicatilis]|uniref:Uncharacterized protein n=1 Tax=Brachionus plicatilis TaxID=10195 RepID=A0A3M7RT32_BRAPC|nr:hypothetical protein BpHYR1_003836 [Brachionus plicatilis]